MDVLDVESGAYQRRDGFKYCGQRECEVMRSVYTAEFGVKAPHAPLAPVPPCGSNRAEEISQLWGKKEQQNSLFTVVCVCFYIYM